GLAIRQRFMETKPDDWHRQIDACLYGAIHCCYAAAPHLDAAGNGRIVSVIGDSSRIGESGLAIVAAARAGVVALMKSLARELGRSGTTANTVSLGLVETPHDKDWVDANRDKLIKLYPLRRLGVPGDVAPMVALLASPHSGWITGQVLSISGGFSMSERGTKVLRTDLIAPIPELLRRNAAARAAKIAYRDAETRSAMPISLSEPGS